MTEAEISSATEKIKAALKSYDNYIIETSIRTSNGITKRLETYGKIERHATGQPQKIIGITRDVTRLKAYEKNLQQKIEELNRSNKELEEFAYIASHDLQEPLRKITAFSERLQERASNEIGSEGQLYLQRILAATQNMRLLIDNLLEFSRTSRNSQSFERVDLNVILKQVVSDLELKIEETHTIIKIASMPEITAIHSQMTQLFTNILANAIKFRKQTEAPLINVSCEKISNQEKANHFLANEKQYYKISISDSGIGFEQEYAVKIFQIFQRLHGKAEYPGSGIGLAICKKIVENHNGIIYAESVPGKGSTFSFILPENQ
jgi:light-regulated signal transduction histidine kinase (bacteriophytochrome)